MKCSNCPESSEGYAVIPGLGESGEIRFYCDRCARNHRVKLRYWDGRVLDVGGYRENPDLGEHFKTLILSFEDVGRMRRDDLRPVMAWLEDPEIALALVGMGAQVSQKVISALPPDRARRVRELLTGGEVKGTAAAANPEAAREMFISVMKRL